MEITLNLVLFKGKKLAKDYYPIQLQFNVAGMSPQRKTIYKCREKDWDRESSRLKPKADNAAYANNFLSGEFLKYDQKKLRVMNGEIGPENFFEKQTVLTLDGVINKEMSRFKAELKTGEYKRFEGYQYELAKYFGSETLNVKTIGISWYEKYASFLASEVKENGKVVKKRNNGSTAQKKVKTIRRIIEKHTKTAPSDDVANFRVPNQKPVKHKWTPAELGRFEALDLSDDPTLEAVRDFFMLQIYLRGSRAGALLQAYAHQFENGRYEAINEDGAKSNVSCKVIPKAQEIVDRYAGKHERLFPFFTFTPDLKSDEFENKRRRIKKKEAATAVLNKGLKVLAKMAGIEKKASTHLARHIFTKRAGDTIKNPMVTMELLGHKSLAVHQQYLKDVLNDDMLDEAADEIFG